MQRTYDELNHFNQVRRTSTEQGKTTTITQHDVTELISEDGQTWNFNLASVLSITYKGYTGHEQVDHASVVQMGGRIYDAHIGRMLQADPFVQSPSNSQNFNRYSYVLNNPLSYTDPSGYLFKKLNKVLGKFAPFLSIAIMFIPGGQGIGAAMLKGFIAGGIASGSLKGALVGAFSAGIGFDVGGDLGFLGNGMVGGMSSVVMGGKFAHGFISAGVSSQLTPGIQNNVSNAYAKVAVHAIAGGTISTATGGKFANGAYSAAFASALREGAARISDYRRSSGLVSLTAEQKAAFEPQFRMLKDKVAQSGRFKSSEAAANWLHENVHSKLTIDVEVGAYIYQTGDEFFIGALQTDYRTNSIHLVRVGSAQPHSSWHSHGTHKGVYWRPTLDDIRLDMRQDMTYGYTSTTHHGGALWRFDVNGFRASDLPMDNNNTRLHMCNLRREGDC